MKTKTLHFKVNDISRTQGHNAVAACAYRVGLNLTDAKTGEVHRYARRGGVVQAALLAAVNSPEWMQDDNQARLWERFGNEIERVEDGHNKRATALLAIDWQAAAPRELTPLQNWKLALTFAALLNARGLAVAVAFHETDASDGGKNPHFHFLVPQRQTDAAGFKKRYYEFTGNPNAIRQAHKRLREEYYACVNDALADAAIDGITYDPNKQEDKLPGVHKGRAVVALERKGIATEIGNKARRVALENKARPFYVGLEQTAKRVFSNEPGATAMEKLHNGMNRMQYAGRAALGGDPNGAALPVAAVPVAAPLPEQAAAPDPLPVSAPAPAAAGVASPAPVAAPAASSSWQDYVTQKKTDREPER